MNALDQTNSKGQTISPTNQPGAPGALVTPVIGGVFSAGTAHYQPNQQPAQPNVSQPVVTTVKSNVNSSQNALQIAEIRDGIVIMNDGSFRSVVMVKSINFDLMSPEEREAVEFSYQGFWVLLTFDLTVFIL